MAAYVRFPPIADLRLAGHQCIMESPELISLGETLVEARDLLRKYGDRYVSARLDDLVRRLALPDTTVVQSALSEATGSMGSLKDRWLCAANGDAIRTDEEWSVNRDLDVLVSEIERRSRVAAAACGIKLVG